MAKARVPDEDRVYRTKPEIALEEIDRVRAAGVRFGCGLADAGYGLSAPRLAAGRRIWGILLRPKWGVLLRRKWGGLNRH